MPDADFDLLTAGVASGTPGYVGGNRTALSRVANPGAGRVREREPRHRGGRHRVRGAPVRSGPRAIGAPAAALASGILASPAAAQNPLELLQRAERLR